MRVSRCQRLKNGWRANMEPSTIFVIVSILAFVLVTAVGVSTTNAMMKPVDPVVEKMKRENRRQEALAREHHRHCLAMAKARR